MTAVPLRPPATGAVLPLRIVEQPGGVVIRCLCDAESAVVRPSAEPPASIVRAARTAPVRNRGISPGNTPADLLRMVLHARRCVAGQNRAREGAR